MSVFERILTKSTELFFGFGINSTSTDDISTGLNISKRTFYEHFESKQQLIEVIVTAEIKRAWLDIHFMQKQNNNVVLEAIHIVGLSLSYHKNRNPNFLRDIQKNYPQIWEHYECFNQEYLSTVLTRNLRRGVNQGYYWPDLSIPVISRLWLELSKVDCQYHDGNRIILNHFIKGLLNEKGLSEYLLWQNHVKPI